MSTITEHTVDGVRVVAEQPVETPLSTQDVPMYFKRVVLLLLEDGREVFGCTECDFTNDAVSFVRAHVSVHNAEPRRKPGPKTREADTSEWADMPLGQLLKLVQDYDTIRDALDRMTDDRNEWKARALKAERQISGLRKVFAP